MTRVKRFDSGSPMKGVVKTANGYLRAPAFATRIGVLSYREPNGKIRRELRHPDDVFDAHSMATLNGIPVTHLHPTEMLDPTNTKKYSVGISGTAGAEGQYVKLDAVTIMDDGAIKAVESGECEELSCGYWCEREDVAGTFEGEPYDCRQRNIVYNHLAIVPKGRAGPDVRLHLDAADAVQVESNTEEVVMEKVILGGKEIEVSKEAAAVIRAHFDAQQAETVKVQAEVAAEKARADAAEGTAAGLKTEVAKAQADLKARTDAEPENVRKAARELARVEGVARRVLDKDTVAKLDSMDEQAIKVAVIKADDADLNLDGKSADYVNACFDTIARRVEKSGDRFDAFGKELHGTRKDATATDAEAARKRQIEESRNAWKGDAK
jgi:hypothetical protein